MDIVISANNRAEVIVLPIVPENIEIAFPHNNEVFSTIGAGDILLIGKDGLRAFTISSFIPNKEYPFAKSKVLAPQFKNFIAKWKKKGQPLRVVITRNDGSTFHNEAYAIEEFTFGLDKAGDMPYTLSLKQFVIKSVKK